MVQAAPGPSPCPHFGDSCSKLLHLPNVALVLLLGVQIRQLPINSTDSPSFLAPLPLRLALIIERVWSTNSIDRWSSPGRRPTSQVIKAGKPSRVMTRTPFGLAGFQVYLHPQPLREEFPLLIVVVVGVSFDTRVGDMLVLGT